MFRIALFMGLTTLLTSCTHDLPPELSQICTIKINTNKNEKEWCEPEKWNIPFEVKVGAKTIGFMQPNNRQIQFDYRRTSWIPEENEISVWAGKRKIGNTLPLCEPPKYGPNLNFIITVIVGKTPNNVAYDLQGCEGIECQEGTMIRRPRTCETSFFLMQK